MLKLVTRLFDKLANGYVNIKHKLTIVYNDKVLLRKIFFTFFLLTIFVICGTITIPGVRLSNFQIDSNSFLGVINTVGGGGLLNFSIVALGISPFITASLIMLIAQTKLFPPIHRLSQSGPHGRRKINIITRILTLVISLVQAVVLVRTVIDNDQLNFVILEDNSFGYRYLAIPLILIAGSLFALFLGEQITDKGVGNGTSLIIFSGIAVGLPRRFQFAFDYIVNTQGSASSINEILGFLSYLVGFLLLMLIVVFVYLAERKIPIQQTGSGMTKNVKEISTLPLKLNPAGIMPIIFSLIVISLPTLFTGFLDINTSAVRNWIANNLRVQDPLGLGLFIFFNIVFTVVMSLQQSRIDKISEDFAKNSTFIPGIRPGEQTEDYLIGVVLRLSVFSAIYLTLLGVLQPVQIMLGLPDAITFSGTSVIILATTALETLSQIKARRDAEKIIVKRKKINKNIAKSNTSKLNEKDLLW
ncbi:preprotein translocase subunit SecY [Mesomycoplasma conjunctivae]|uniref:Protein translocase subunit SecY n=1 Tax=Mesomycoplasma conjunctivae (strain ATCC 25834 / NCTC 10147 / HRC/581) TaxID=572263 RepID=C5J5V0_MESCH|nr:preprotein translocase subunit SecY [Mesomycoplasma conjunctivae]CAT04839.1 Preprotein translocase SecY subunit [Mesomycoplasma conjunctivae]VEU65895.1 preprotein translocase subunit SecY [Mesomycoplasma conjunctivae]